MHASQQNCHVQCIESDDVVTVSSSDAEEALELLPLSPNHGVSLQPSGGDG
jgi:hypothetical protein